MTINIQEHMLVPKHEIMNDPVVKAIDAKEHDILRITRESDTAGTFVTYRIVKS